MASDDTALTHLSRLGVNPVTSANLRGLAEESDVSLRELVAIVLSDYVARVRADRENSTPNPLAEADSFEDAQATEGKGF